jgi:hypothetical protein
MANSYLPEGGVWTLRALEDSNVKNLTVEKRAMIYSMELEHAQSTQNALLAALKDEHQAWIRERETVTGVHGHTCDTCQEEPCPVCALIAAVEK